MDRRGKGGLSKKADIVVIGAGIIGATLAIELKQRYPDCSVMLLEKEPFAGFHASGRNSGILHAGFYYTADSLKARFTRDGNILWRDYCREKGLRINESGKLVVAISEKDLVGLDELCRRGERNGVPLHYLTAKEAQEIEPRVVTYGYALYSPTTASIDPREVVATKIRDAVNFGIDIQYGCKFLLPGSSGREVVTNHGKYEVGYLVNAAGLYADRIALQYGFSDSYRILPFKGLYIYATKRPFKLHTNIYPVPDMSKPFLGAHFTLTVDGHVTIGPTAIPAFWREHYNGMSRFKADEFFEIVWREWDLFRRNTFGFRDLAFEEIKKYRKGYMVREAAAMLRGSEALGFRKRGHPGIRAQLLNIKTGQLEMDFKYEGDDRSFHVLNAVSPAFTCAIPFSKYLADRIQQLIK